MQTMPPRASLTSSFSVTDVNNEVVCPLKNNDGSNCRKRCLGVSSTPSARFSPSQLSLLLLLPARYRSEPHFHAMVSKQPAPLCEDQCGRKLERKKNNMICRITIQA